MAEVRVKRAAPVFSTLECREIVWPSNPEDQRLQTDVADALLILCASPSYPEFPDWLIKSAEVVNVFGLIEEFG